MGVLYVGFLREARLFTCLPVAVHLCIVRLLIGMLFRKDRLAAVLRK